PFWIGSFFAFSGFILGFLYFEKFKSFYKGVQEKFGNNRNLDKETKKVLLLNFVNFFAIGGVFFLFPKLATKIGYSSTKISNILSFLFLVRFLMFFVFSKINLKINEKNFFFSYLFVFITLILTGFVKSTFLHTIFISFLGISSAYSYKLGLFTVIKKGYSTEINESIIGIGLFSGPLIVGTLSQFFGIYNGFVLSGFLIILFFLLHKYLIK
ncbi:MAG: hypothetical protein NZ891_01605, partial [bacterium]|nr:hypothetical protein [bacterium]MDW8163423.1 hypothetical protein [Candidatus Omnitrophota bacterium]